MLTLITGGAASGKSEYAETVAASFCKQIGGQGYYVATMIPFGKEAEQRIARHRALRKGKGFQTVECPLHLNGLRVPKKSVVLLECLSNLIANELFEPSGAGPNTVQVVLSGVESLCRQAAETVVVTNEIFSDGVRYPQATQTYRQILGQINRELAARAANVIEVVFSIPVVYKGKGGLF